MLDWSMRESPTHRLSCSITQTAVPSFVKRTLDVLGSHVQPEPSLLQAEGYLWISWPSIRPSYNSTCTKKTMGSH